MPESPTTRPDSADFRDLIYRPSLQPLHRQIIPDKESINIRHQGVGGACTGFALAALIDNLNRCKKMNEPVSARMLYEMAKRHDQWAGENYQGSSARGAMKGWQKNGVCPEQDWPYINDKPGYLTSARQRAALKYPLGAYYRVNRRRSDLHAAICETGAVFVTTATHWGWYEEYQTKKGWINADYATRTKGGHAVVLLGYTEDGFIIQNSWGENWGGLTIKGIQYPGCAMWAYADAEYNMWNAWVARMALPMTMAAVTPSTSREERPARSPMPRQFAVRDHYIHFDNGQLDPFGDYPSDEHQVREIIAKAMKKKHILLYVHGGANDVKSAAKRVMQWHEVFEKNNIFEIHIIWKSGIFEEIKDIVCSKEEQASKRASGLADWTDRYIERITQPLGHALWNEMQTDARRAFAPKAAGRNFLQQLVECLQKIPNNKRPQIHIAGHSAGAIWLAHLLKCWQSLRGAVIENMILLAPACTTKLYNSTIYPALRRDYLRHLHHFQLDEMHERADNVALIYRKSILYLVSRSFQTRRKIVPIMGMQKYRNKLKSKAIKDQIFIYNPEDNRDATRAQTHAGFDNDETTMNKMLRIVAGKTLKFKFIDEIHLKN